MATGASTADLAVILIDARHGVLTQTRRHAFIGSLLGIQHVVVAVNKMDLVDWSRGGLRRDPRATSPPSPRAWASSTSTSSRSARSAATTWSTRSANMPWYDGATLLDHLENVHIAGDRNLIDLRFPVQHVLRPHLDFRGYAGTVASGVVRRGDEVVACPRGAAATIAAVHVRRRAGRRGLRRRMAVTVTLADEIDVCRGDMLVHP